MGQLRQVLNTIGAQVTRLTASQKLLIGSLAVVMLMTLFLVSQYAGGKQFVELLPGATAEQQQQALELLEVNNIPHRMDNGRLMVVVGNKHYALAQLSQGGALPADSSLLFSNIVEKQSWAMSTGQRKQMERFALQNELALTIGQFDGVRSAKVLVDVPAPIGLGASARRPSASATVFTDGGAISQRTVDAVAGLIAGAISGLDIENIRVIDGSTNTQRRPTGDDEALASTNFEHTQKVEKRIRDKLLDQLAYIEGVIVAVNAQVDTRRISTESRRILPNGGGSQTFPLSENTKEETQKASSPGAEGGVRSNTGLNINTGSGGGTQMSRNESESTLSPQIGYENQRVIDPRGVVTKLNATINVPKSYFVARYKDLNGADAEPKADELKPVVDQEIARIRADVEPQIDTINETGDVGTVIVSMIPDWTGASGSTASAGVGPMGLGGGTISMPGLVRTIALGGLAFVSLGLMARTLKRASKPIELPSMEELIGKPPMPPVETDMFGEAVEAEAALSGIELTESQIERRKMLEQITTLANAQPAEAAFLLNKWIDAID